MTHVEQQKLLSRQRARVRMAQSMEKKGLAFHMVRYQQGKLEGMRVAFGY